MNKSEVQEKFAYDVIDACHQLLNGMEPLVMEVGITKTIEEAVNQIRAEFNNKMDRITYGEVKK